MTEQALAIGDNPKLFGIVSGDKNISPQKPLLLMVNSGLLNRTGPFRLHVNIAREIAELGLACCRFDLSGIGDSDRRLGSTARSQQHLDDIRQVMDFFEEKYQVNRFIVMGICTGADNAHRSMVDDKRVVGAISIDGYSYPTKRYRFNKNILRYFQLSTWINWLKRRFQKIEIYQAVDDKDDVTRLDYRWELPPREKIEADYRQFIQENSRLLCIFTSSWPYNYRRQLADAFPQLDFGDAISLAFLKDAEHTFPTQDDRDRLMSTIRQWLQVQFLKESA